MLPHALASLQLAPVQLFSFLPVVWFSVNTWVDMLCLSSFHLVLFASLLFQVPRISFLVCWGLVSPVCQVDICDLTVTEIGDEFLAGLL
ncbi:hypothetical protein B0T24DRAFT_635576 [Lasiosphaeria ovina]|uniref:Uncharacterized protein n=1 Tax=Lasiosphaeria ovina TaxID=92902 RepID=A0AAE0JZS4_9PEZI|nr:hypothetical protein B0T24DRAFT_635576 [Lasiosphaeria ovina]